MICNVQIVLRAHEKTMGPQETQIHVLRAVIMGHNTGSTKYVRKKHILEMTLIIA